MVRCQRVSPITGRLMSWWRWRRRGDEFSINTAMFLQTGWMMQAKQTPAELLGKQEQKAFSITTYSEQAGLKLQRPQPTPHQPAYLAQYSCLIYPFQNPNCAVPCTVLVRNPASLLKEKKKKTIWSNVLTRWWTNTNTNILPTTENTKRNTETHAAHAGLYFCKFTYDQTLCRHEESWNFCLTLSPGLLRSTSVTYLSFWNPVIWLLIHQFNW